MDRLAVIFVSFAFLYLSEATVTMNRNGDVALHSLMNGNVILDAGNGDVVVEHSGKRTNLMNSLAVLDKVAGQLCWLTPSTPAPTWTKLQSPMQIEGADSAAVSVGTKIYIVGGTNSQGTIGWIQIYDTKTNSWSTAGPLKQSRRKPFVAADPSGQNIFIFGGFQNNNTVANVIEIFNVQTGNFSTKPSNFDFTDYLDGAAALNYNVLYFFGGNTESVAQFDLVQQAFVDLTLSNTGMLLRKSYSAASVDNFIWLLGGRDINGDVTSAVQVFDTNSNTFTNMSDFIPRENIQLLNHQGLLYTLGGSMEVGNITLGFKSLPLKTTSALNPRSNVWKVKTLIDNLGTPRDGAAAVSIDNRLYAFGGRSNITTPIFESSAEWIIPCF